MPGTVVRDSLATDLLAAHTLTTAGASASAGTALEILWPGEVQFALDIPAVTGSNPVMWIEIEGCESSDFSTTDVTTIGEITVGDEADDTSFGLTTHVDSKYVRAVVSVSGTTAVYTGSTLKAVLPHDRRVRGVSPSTQTAT